MGDDAPMPKITRTTARSVDVAYGPSGLSRVADEMCNEVERNGNEVVSVLHAAHNEGFNNKRVWTVLVTYRKADPDERNDGGEA